MWTLCGSGQEGGCSTARVSLRGGHGEHVASAERRLQGPAICGCRMRHGRGCRAPGDKEITAQ